MAKIYVLKLVSLDAVPLISGHSLIPETLKPCVAMVNGSVLIIYTRNVLKPIRCSSCNFFLLPQVLCI